MYLLDTNACIHVLNNSAPRLVKRLKTEKPGDIRLSSITKSELIYGARHSVRAAQNLRTLQRFWAPYVSLPFDDDCAEHCGTIRAEIAKQGRPIGPNDVLIASIARAHNLVLVTHNVREFERVPELRIEDWE